MTKEQEDNHNKTGAILEYMKIPDEKISCLMYFGYAWVKGEKAFFLKNHYISMAMIRKLSLVDLFELLSERNS